LIINPSCLGEFDRPKVGEFEVANGALVELVEGEPSIESRSHCTLWLCRIFGTGFFRLLAFN
jgi:hypothetical protein